MFVKVKPEGKVPEEIILEIGEIQEDESADIEKELKIKFDDTTAFFYIDDTLLGSFDLEHMWTFKDVLTRVLNVYDELFEIERLSNE